MKTTLLLLVLTFPFYISSPAQSHKAGFNVSIPDASSNKIFDENPDLDFIYIRYKNGEPAQIDFNERSEKPGGKLTETYFTRFEGDCFALSKKHPGFKIPQMPKLDVWHFADIKHLRDSNVKVTQTTTIKRDTTVHKFNYFITKYWFEGLDFYQHPRLKANILDFQRKLTLNYQQWKPIAVADSTLVISGIVEKEGSFGNIKLLLGKPSPFSDEVLKFISQEAKVWWPTKVQGSKIMRGYTKIFVRINPDDTLTFSTL